MLYNFKFSNVKIDLQYILKEDIIILWYDTVRKIKKHGTNIHLVEYTVTKV